VGGQAMAADRIGIGFIGAGGIAKQRHLPGLKKLDGIDFVAVANRRRETAEQVAKEWGFKSVLDDWRQVLERKDVDAVFITAPPHWRQDDRVSGFNTQFLGMFLEVIHRWLGFHRRVQAITKVHYPKRPRPDTNETAEVKIADSLAFVTEMENGALSSWHFSGVVQHPLPNRFEIFGSDGTLIVEMGAGEAATVRGAEKGEELKEIPIRDEERRRWAAEEDF